MDITSWPDTKKFPFGVQSDYSWNEIGALLRLIDEYNVGLVIETGVNRGDFAAWMMAICMFNTKFHYVGITCNIDLVDESVSDFIRGVPQAFISKGLSYSDAILAMVKKYINNSFSRVLVFCNGANVEKEFNAYMNILRPGDVICVSGFPVSFSLKHVTAKEQDKKLKRIASNWITSRTRLIAGIVL